MKKICVSILSFLLIFSMCGLLTSYAKDNETSDETVINGNYYISEQNGVIVKSAFSFRMGGGIGRCTKKNKTFSYVVTRSQAEAALKAIQLGEGSARTLAKLLYRIMPEGVKIAVDIVLEYVGGEFVYESNLKTFVNSGKSKAYFKFKTHCENVGYMYGDPMYDYVIDSVSMTY